MRRGPLPGEPGEAVAPASFGARKSSQPVDQPGLEEAPRAPRRPPSTRRCVTPRAASRASRSARSTRPRRRLAAQVLDAARRAPGGASPATWATSVGAAERWRKSLQAGREREPGVEDDADRVAAAPAGEAGGEAGVVGAGRAGAHQHRVDRVAEPVHQRARLRAGHPARVAGARWRCVPSRVTASLEGDVGAAGW